jgi:biopolymer transport protein ExbD
MRRREPLSPDMTPLIDVVFLLLIFFLVSTSFKKDELALLLNLPTSQASQEMIAKEEVNI